MGKDGSVMEEIDWIRQVTNLDKDQNHFSSDIPLNERSWNFLNE